MQNDFDFSALEAAVPKKIDYKTTMFQPKTGNNVIRLYTLQGRKQDIHWIYEPRAQSVRCPGKAAGCPLCLDGQPTVISYFSKVIDRSTGTLKCWEANQQMFNSIEKLIGDVQRSHGLNAEQFTQHDLIVVKTMANWKPHLDVRFVMAAPDSTQRSADEALISTDALDLAAIAKPWDVEGLTRFLNENPANLKRRQS